MRSSFDKKRRRGDADRRNGARSLSYHRDPRPVRRDRPVRRGVLRGDPRLLQAGDGRIPPLPRHLSRLAYRNRKRNFGFPWWRPDAAIARPSGSTTSSRCAPASRGSRKTASPSASPSSAPGGEGHPRRGREDFLPGHRRDWKTIPLPPELKRSLIWRRAGGLRAAPLFTRSICSASAVGKGGSRRSRGNAAGRCFRGYLREHGFDLEGCEVQEELGEQGVSDPGAREARVNPIVSRTAALATLPNSPKSTAP